MLQECEFTALQSCYIEALTQQLTDLQAESAQLRVVHAQLQHEVHKSAQLHEELHSSEAAPVTQVRH